MIQIRTDLWPAPGHYNSGQVSALSLFALHLQILNQNGNLLKESPGGQYFFRDTSIPLPRPATADAWTQLCSLGTRDSKYFLVPFLPSIRSDEEQGEISTLSGSGAGKTHLKTLTRRSKLHIRDKSGRITWGSVYIGRGPDSEYPLCMELARSDITESLVIPREQQVTDLSHRSESTLRFRIEFLSQFGMPASSGPRSPLAPVRRVLFQCTNQRIAEIWARSYIEASQRLSENPELERIDYYLMIQEFLSRENETQPLESKKTSAKNKLSFKLDLSELSL